MSTSPKLEKCLQDDLVWLIEHNKNREYMLVQVLEPIDQVEQGNFDPAFHDLDDDLPW